MNTDYADHRDITLYRKTRAIDLAECIDIDEVSPEEAGVRLNFVAKALAYLPFVKVVEDKNVIKVYGVPSSVLQKYIYKQWNTSKITRNLFIEEGARYFSFYSFYAIEVVYILGVLKENKSMPKRYHAIIDTITEQIFLNTWLSKSVDAEPLPLDRNVYRRFNLELLPSQSEFIENYAEYIPKSSMVGMLLHADPGTGKTLNGLAWSMALGYDVLIVVAPKKSISDVWAKHAERQFKVVPKYFDSISGNPLVGDEEFVFIHFDYLDKFIRQMGIFKGKKIGVWLDESHNFNEIKSLRVDLFNQMCVELKPLGVVWASGTPLKALGKETIPLLRSIDTLFTEDVQKSFLKLFGSSKNHALDILNNRMAKVTFRVLKADVAKNEVNEVVTDVFIPNEKPYLLKTVKEEIKEYVIERMAYYRKEMPKYEKQFEHYTEKYRIDSDEYDRWVSTCKRLHRFFDPKNDREDITWCSSYESRNIHPILSSADRVEFKKTMSVYKYYTLVVRGEALGRILTKRRIECFKEMVAHYDFTTEINNAVKKTIIFTSYVACVDAIYDRLVKEGFKPLKVYGDTNKDLSNILKEFRSNYEANPIIATYDSLSDAVTITEASTCILFNSPFRSYIRNQATSRIDRYGQDSVVTIVSPRLNTGKESNLSTRSIDIAEWSKETVDSILGLD